jgi:hypothetical protein
MSEKTTQFSENGQYKRLTLVFEHVASGQRVEFMPYITDFSDDYEQQWNPVEVFGRMDTIKNFKRTMRKIQISFDVPSESYEEAKKNMWECSRFLRMNYPVYQETSKELKIDPIPQGDLDRLIKADTTKPGEKEQVNRLKNKIKKLTDLFSPAQGRKPTAIMTAPPILRARFGNLIHDPNEGPDKMLYGTITGMSYKPDVEMGFWSINGVSQTFKDHEVALTPKVVSFTLTFEVLHTHPLGYDYNDRQGNILQPRSRYPYQTNGKK